jgi:hypothetical protein
MGLLKDGAELLLNAWRAVRERSTFAVFQSSIARAKGWTVDEWYSPFSAVTALGDPDWLQRLREAEQRREKARAERDKLSPNYHYGFPLFGEEPEEPEEPETRERFLALDEQYKEAKLTADAATSVIMADLQNQLIRGELIARGFREPFAQGAPYLTISRHEWHVIRLEEFYGASGGGVTYIGLTIGRAGTKRFFRRKG